MALRKIVYDAISVFETLHLVQVRNFKIGLIHRLVQLVIVVYVIGFVIIYQKEYQDTDMAQSSVTTKVKGVVSTLYRLDLPPEYRRVWDTVDYVIPPQENGAFFIMTNAIVNEPQTFGRCAESAKKAPCISSVQCRKGDISKGGTGNGVMTGECVETMRNRAACEITGWCPVEKDDLLSPAMPLLPEAYNFTVLIKNSVSFPQFGKKKRNIPENTSPDYFNCRQSSSNPTCPVLTLGYMVHEAGGDFNAMATNGGVINVKIDWDCDLDYDFDTWCQPKYSFDVMDSGKEAGAPGWNFRYANYYRNANGTLAREVIKAHGILFVFTVRGEAGKFSVVPLLLNIGAGLALLGLASFVCDFLLLHCVKNRQVYKDHKFEVIQEDKLADFALPYDPPVRKRRADVASSVKVSTSNHLECATSSSDSDSSDSESSCNETTSSRVVTSRRRSKRCGLN